MAHAAVLAPAGQTQDANSRPSKSFLGQDYLPAEHAASNALVPHPTRRNHDRFPTLWGRYVSGGVEETYNLRHLLDAYREVPTVHGLKDIIVSRNLPMRRIFRLVLDAFGASEADVLSQRRASHIVKARQAAMYLMRLFTNKSYPEIGRFLGRDHSTVLHGVITCEERMSRDPGYRSMVEDLQARLVALRALQ